MRFRVDPDPERDTRPRDTYDVIDGDSCDPIVESVTHAEATFIAAVLNGEVTANDLRADAWDEALDEVSASYTVPLPDNPYREEAPC